MGFASQVLAWHAQGRLHGLHTCLSEPVHGLHTAQPGAPPPPISFMQLEPGAVAVGVAAAGNGDEKVAWVRVRVRVRVRHRLRLGGLGGGGGRCVHRLVARRQRQ